MKGMSTSMRVRNLSNGNDHQDADIMFLYLVQYIYHGTGSAQNASTTVVHTKYFQFLLKLAND